MRSPERENMGRSAAINLHDGHHNGKREEELAAERLHHNLSTEDCLRYFAF